MFLDKYLAEKVITEIKKIIDFDINIINTNGFILASTNKQRVDNFHEAAHLLIENRHDELIVEYEEQYQGCKKGVNLPIYFSGMVVGVIGITGEPKEVIKYARILQKMTGMLVYEFFDRWNRNNTEQTKLTFTNSLVLGNIMSTLFNVEERLKAYKLNIDGLFTVGLIKNLVNKKDIENKNVNNAKLNIIEQYISDKLSYRNSLVSFNGEFHIVISNLSELELLNEMQYLSKKVKELYEVRLICSIGNSYEQYVDIPKSYNEALSLLDYIGGEPGVYQFSDFSISVVLNKIPDSYKSIIKNHVFLKCSKKEIQEYAQFIKDYFLLDGSLSRLAKKYYVHKNTVQYKIQKIKEKTGYDLRTYKDLLVLYLASVL